MTYEEAEDFIGEYRVNARKWSLIMSDLADGDAESLRLWIENGAARLEELEASFPDLSYSAGTLRGLRTYRRTRIAPCGSAGVRPDGWLAPQVTAG